MIANAAQLRETCARKPHGVRARYMAGCRCPRCRRANSQYVAARAKARRGGDRRELVEIAVVQAHLDRLAELGLTMGEVAGVAGMDPNNVRRIRRGGVAHVRRSTAAKILAVRA